MTKKLTLDALNAAAQAGFVAALANVVEHSPWIAEAAERARPFARLADLRAAMLGVIDTASPERRLALIRAHPDLANKTQRAEGLTAESISEQNGAGLDRLSDAELALFGAANTAYKDKFGFPFILCVRRHTKDSILDAFNRRLTHDPQHEEREAVGEIGRIAALRLAELVGSAEPLLVHGRLSTHVLDTHAGCPGAGIVVELVGLSRHGLERLIVKTVTNADGRTDTALVHDRPVPIGIYELRFGAGAYYTSRGTPLSDPPFLDTILIRFGVSEAEAHLHVPLLMTPSSYTTYRGS
jgi:2-oxo-4-hydroxy-4-carboxy-5-ureidoimidazoline decarboxylase